MHAYVREIQPGRDDDSLSRLAALVPQGACVLDVGTGSGGLGAYLSRSKACVVDGVTANPAEAEMARPNYRTVWVCDLDQTLPEALRDVRYDVIVCADVLEHLNQPEALLRALRPLLMAQGQLLLSVPNVTFLGVRLNMLAGRFARTQEGLLDGTHRQFWDRAGLAELCQSAGFRVEHADAVVRNLLASEFAAFDALALPAQVRDYVYSGVDASIYQFLWTLVPTEQMPSGRIELPALPPTDMTPQFLAEIFWDHGAGFHAGARTGAVGRMSEGVQTLMFALPDAPLRAVRLDIADRPGVLEVLDVRACDATGALVWRWSLESLQTGECHECEWGAGIGPFGGLVLFAQGPDPWFVLPAPSGPWSAATRIEIDLTCPMRYAGVGLQKSYPDWACAQANQVTDVAKLQLQVDALQAELGAIQASRAWRCLQLLRRGWARLRDWP